MALKETFVTKTIDKATSPTDWASDKVTRATDGLVDRAENPDQTEKRIKWTKRGIRWAGRAAMATLVYRTTGDMIEAVSQLDPSAITPDVMDYALAGGFIGASIASTERGNKQITYEHELARYASPDQIGGATFSPTGEIVERTTGNAIAGYTSSNASPLLENDMGVSSGRYVDLGSRKVYDETHTPMEDLYINQDNEVLDLTTATESADVVFDGLEFKDIDGNVLNYRLDFATGKVIDIDSGEAVPDLFVTIDNRVLDTSTARRSPYSLNEDVICVTDEYGEIQPNHLIDMNTGVVFNGENRYIDETIGSGYNLSSGMIELIDGTLADPDTGELYRRDGTQIVEVVTANPGDPEPVDADGNAPVASTRSTERIIKRKWSKRTSAGSRAGMASLGKPKPTSSLRKDAGMIAKDAAKGAKSVSGENSGIAQELLQKSREARVAYHGNRVRRLAKKHQKAEDRVRKIDSKRSQASDRSDILTDEIIGRSRSAHSARRTAKSAKMSRRSNDQKYKNERKLDKLAAEIERNRKPKLEKAIGQYNEKKKLI